MRFIEVIALKRSLEFSARKAARRQCVLPTRNSHSDPMGGYGWSQNENGHSRGVEDGTLLVFADGDRPTTATERGGRALRPFSRWSWANTDHWLAMRRTEAMPSCILIDAAGIA